MLSNGPSKELESDIPKKRSGIREFRKERKIILFSPHTNLECHLSGLAIIIWDFLSLNLETRGLKQLICSALKEFSVSIPPEFSMEMDRLLKEMSASGLIKFARNV